MTVFDVAIVGGGCVGLAVGWLLSRSGQRVLIAERPGFTWFVKMTGPEGETRREDARFDEFVSHLVFREAT